LDLRSVGLSITFDYAFGGWVDDPMSGCALGTMMTPGAGASRTGRASAPAAPAAGIARRIVNEQRWAEISIRSIDLSVTLRKVKRQFTGRRTRRPAEKSSMCTLLIYSGGSGSAY